MEETRKRRECREKEDEKRKRSDEKKQKQMGMVDKINGRKNKKKK